MCRSALLYRLAQESGELVRLAVRDGDDLVFVAKAQGATRGLRYDPDMGMSVPLSCSAAGHALLSTMSDEDALPLVSPPLTSVRIQHYDLGLRAVRLLLDMMVGVAGSGDARVVLRPQLVVRGATAGAGLQHRDDWPGTTDVVCGPSASSLPAKRGMAYWLIESAPC